MAESTPRKHWVGFDLGGTKMLATVFDGDFNPLGSRRRKTKGHEGSKAGLERIESTIRRAMEIAEVSQDELKGIGVGCPGPLDLDKGIILEAPNLGWEDVRIKKFLEDAFSCPVMITNDVDAGVYGEYRFGSARDAHCAVGVFPGTGIGGGCVYEGRILRGRTASCMEVGHIRVVPEGPLCGCGQKGCLEAVASRLAVSAAAAQASFRGQAPNLRVSEGTDISEIRSGAIAASIKAGDKVVEQIVIEAARHLGTAVGGLVHLLAPDVIVLGGGLVEAIPELHQKTVEKAAREFVLPTLEDSFKVVVATLGDDAAVMGAAAWAQQNIAQPAHSTAEA